MSTMNLNPQSPQNLKRRVRGLVITVTGIAVAMAVILFCRALMTHLFIQEQPPLSAVDPALQAFLAVPLTHLDGKPYTLQRLRGKPLLLNVWAPWCAPCVAELPELSTLFTELEKTNNAPQFVGVGVDSQENLAAFAAQIPISFPLVFGNTAGLDLAKALDGHRGALPFTVLFDAQGRVIGKKTGRVTNSEVLGWLNKAKTR
jgi:thiol-disulfide isomerase/thioredoxin